MRHERVIGRQRKHRSIRVRNRLKRDATCRPRLCVFRSGKHCYAQIIDDQSGRTLAAVGTIDKQFKEQAGHGGNKAAAEWIGKAIAERALQAGVKEVVLDRREYKYHGRVAALAEAAASSRIGILEEGRCRSSVVECGNLIREHPIGDRQPRERVTVH